MPNTTERSGWIGALLAKLASLRWSHALIGALLIGALLRLVHYGIGRMLWVDEAMLAVNLMSRSGAELLSPLDFRQVAPSGWVLLVDGVVDLTRSYEYGGRLPSLLASLLSLWLFYKISVTQLSKPIALVAVSIFAISFSAVYYSAEIKPYIFDMLLWLSLAWVALKVIDLERIETKELAILIVIFLFGSCFTLAAPIVIGAIGGSLIVNRYLQGDLRAAVALAMGAGAAAAIYLFLSLTIYKTQVDISGISDGGMGNYFGRLYAPFPLTSASDFIWYPTVAEELIVDLFGIQSAHAVAFLAICGSIVALRKNVWLAALCLSPIVIATVLSMAHVYPLMARLMLYVVPIAILLAALALDRLFEDAKGLLPAILIGALVFLGFGSVSKYVHESTFAPHQSNRDISTELSTIAENAGDGDVVLLTRWSLPTYLLYRHKFGLEDQRWAIAEQARCLKIASIDQLEADRIWLFKPFGRWRLLDEHLEVSPKTRADKSIIYTPAPLIEAMDWLRTNRLEELPSDLADCTTVRDLDAYLNGGIAPIQLGELFTDTQ